jgi:hypothetical protein
LTWITVGRPANGQVWPPGGAYAIIYPSPLGNPLLGIVPRPRATIAVRRLGGLVGDPIEGQSGLAAPVNDSGGYIVCAASLFTTEGPADVLTNPPVPAGPLTIVGVIIKATGEVTITKNGFLTTYSKTTTTPAAPYALDRLDVFPSYSAYDMTKDMGWGRELSTDEFLSSVRYLGLRYNIPTA